MTDEPTVTYAYAAGQEVELAARPGLPAKVIEQLVREDGTPAYRVQFSSVEIVDEDGIATPAT